MKKVRIVSLAYDNSSGPYLCIYQILSKYFKLLRSYGVHKNLHTCHQLWTKICMIKQILREI